MQKSSLFAAIIGGIIAFYLITHTSILSKIPVSKSSSPDVYAADKVDNVRNAKVYAGEVPSTSDYDLLKKKGVRSVVCLLDPEKKEESDLMNQDKSRAQSNGMKFYDFPMSYDHRCPRVIRDKHEAHLAAREIDEQSGPVYLHSDRDVHRTAWVQEYLPAKTSTSQFITKDTQVKDRAKYTDMEMAYDRGQYPRCLAVSKTFNKPTATVWIYRGWSHYHQNKIKEAQHDFSQAYSLSSRRVDANDGLGYCALREGKTDDAEMRFQDALKEKPMNCEALVGMGYVRYRQGRRAEAIHYFREVLAMNPDDYDAWAGLRMMGESRVASAPVRSHSHPGGY